MNTHHVDTDHEARKKGVPRSTVEGEARRTAAEDPSDQVKDVLKDAKENEEAASAPRDRDRREGDGAAEPEGDAAAPSAPTEG
ncbi:hypothetical protein KDK95_23485 [Actinospica sp. MGRD01-02]|uniref:Uncharacterized protein n=1 Tax=Actinospica acidithermotolerans TaxID=2828514 RepID=A0A941II61_9ACTN|nr:hypothetical protein [Actinospica acidithermotolerans]MBR7829290.1 hypothetical protein [Actinospica acidithermotolerans]